MTSSDIKFFSKNHEITKTRIWVNKDNLSFYEAMSNDLYKKLIENSGIANNLDVENIAEYILKANSIFEIGLCRGRVIKACQEMGYHGKFSGIEIAPSFCKELRLSFPNATIFEGDFLSSSFHKQYDLVLLMGSTLATFSLQEQKKCIERAKSILIPGSYLIIDNYLSHSKPSNQQSLPIANTGFYIMEVNGQYHAGYHTSMEEINIMANELGFELVSKVSYTGSNDVTRFCMVFANS